MSLPILAKSEVLERVDGDIKFLEELTNQFLANFPADFATLQAAYNQSDYSAIGAKSHSLKGALRNLGALKSGQVAYTIEMEAKQENLSKIEPLLKELADAVEEFKKEFAKESLLTV